MKINHYFKVDMTSKSYQAKKIDTQMTEKLATLSLNLKIQQHHKKTTETIRVCCYFLVFCV